MSSMSETYGSLAGPGEQEDDPEMIINLAADAAGGCAAVGGEMQGATGQLY